MKKDPCICCLKWSEVKVTQSCLTLCNPMDYTVHAILQAKTVERVAYPFSIGSSQPRNQTRVSCIAGRFFLTTELSGKLHMLSRRDWFQITHRLRVKERKKFILCPLPPKCWVVILILNKVDFKVKTVTKNKERHYIITRGHSNKKV